MLTSHVNFTTYNGDVKTQSYSELKMLIWICACFIAFQSIPTNGIPIPAKDGGPLTTVAMVTPHVTILNNVLTSQEAMRNDAWVGQSTTGLFEKIQKSSSAETTRKPTTPSILTTLNFPVSRDKLSKISQNLEPSVTPQGLISRDAGIVQNGRVKNKVKRGKQKIIFSKSVRQSRAVRRRRQKRHDHYYYDWDFGAGEFEERDERNDIEKFLDNWHKDGLKLVGLLSVFTCVFFTCCCFCRTILTAICSSCKNNCLACCDRIRCRDASYRKFCKVAAPLGLELSYEEYKKLKKSYTEYATNKYGQDVPAF